MGTGGAGMGGMAVPPTCGPLTVNFRQVPAPGVTFTEPTYVTQAPGDPTRLFVLERAGRILAVSGTTVATFLDIQGRVRDVDSNEQGLLGLAFHPDYQQNGRLFVHYTSEPNGNTQLSEFTRATADSASAGSERTILAWPQPASNHNGGMIEFGPDGMLYLSLGDGGSGCDPDNFAQDMGSLLGKISRIDVDPMMSGTPYAVPSDNPFVGTAGARPEIWVLGLRNPWRTAFDRATGDLYIADVGQDMIEEVDVLPAGVRGRNFGWRILEGNTCVMPQGDACPAIASCTRPAAYTPPILTHPHADGICSITGGFVYRGSAIPAARGAYFYSDFCDPTLRSLRWTAAGSCSNPPQTSVPWTAVSSFGQGLDGELYVTDFNDGVIYQLVP